jgi:ribulose-5-phosphate 4-epimerase/fuculose-1-phosphate aldolase
MTDTAVDNSLTTTLRDARWRCARQGLLSSPDSGLSVRLPGEASFLFLDASASAPQRQSWRTPPPDAPTQLATHATIYQLRQDVGAVLSGGGAFSRALADFGGLMPVAFDEQARHLGRMRAAAPREATAQELRATLGDGANTALVANQPICLGTTCQRLVLNAELFEKCAQAYVLAAATGQTVSTLPWWVCRIAIGRLRKDQRRARQRFAQGLLPEETRGY